MAELQAERASHLRALADERERYQRELREARETDQKTNTALREDSERAVAEAVRRQQAEMQELRAQLAIEKESWEDMFMRKQHASIKQKVDLCNPICMCAHMYVCYLTAVSSLSFRKNKSERS